MCAPRLPKAVAAAAACLLLQLHGAVGAHPTCPSRAAPDAQCAAGDAPLREDEVNLLTMSTQVHLRMPRVSPGTAKKGPSASAAPAAVSEISAAGSSASAAAPAEPATKKLAPVAPAAPAAQERLQDLDVGLDPYAQPWPVDDRTVTLPLSLVYAAVLSFFLLISFAIYFMTGCGELLGSVADACRHRRGAKGSGDTDFLFRVLNENSEKKQRETLYLSANGAVKIQEDSSDDCSLPRPSMEDEAEPESEAELPPDCEEPDVRSPWALDVLNEAAVDQIMQAAANKVLEGQQGAAALPQSPVEQGAPEDSCSCAAVDP